MPLTPSQRIKILKEVSNQLADSEWPEIDLVLTQFQLPTENSWNGSKAAYVLEMANRATDDVLNGLGEHFGLPAAETGAPAVSHPSFWKEGTFKVFISHLAIYRTFAGELQEQLMKLGISAFVAHNDIEPTTEWQIEIEKALATCDSLVALLHSDFIRATGLTRNSALPWGEASPSSQSGSVKTPTVLLVDSKHSTVPAKLHLCSRMTSSMHTASTSKHRR